MKVRKSSLNPTIKEIQTQVIVNLLKIMIEFTRILLKRAKSFSIREVQEMNTNIKLNLNKYRLHNNIKNVMTIETVSLRPEIIRTKVR